MAYTWPAALVPDTNVRGGSMVSAGSGADKALFAALRELALVSGRYVTPGTVLEADTPPVVRYAEADAAR